MQITWHGHSCFTIKNGTGTVVTDPYDPATLGLKLPSLSANIVTVSHSHPGHSNSKAIEGKPLVFDTPGEYEASEIAVIAVPSWHNAKDKEDRGPNIIFSFSFEDINICHLGDLGHVLTAEQNDQLGDVDVLLVPVGGVNTLEIKKTKELIEKIAPGIVIPMHYKIPGLKYELGSLDDFLKEMGIPAQEKQTTLKIEKKDLPKEDEDFLIIPMEPVLA
jgi:L-ascorbate metabolism protein UlaG (beta-lactamase superfamily)